MARTYQALRKCGLRMNRWNSDRSAKRRATCRRRRRRHHRLLCRRRCRRRSERPRGLMLYCPLDLILCRSVSLTHSLAVPPERNKKNKTARLHTKRKHGRTASPCMARQSCRALSSAVATTTVSARPSPVVPRRLRSPWCARPPASQCDNNVRVAASCSPAERKRTRSAKRVFALTTTSSLRACVLVVGRARVHCASVHSS